MGRIIKLQPQYRQHKWHRISIVPKLILSGKWLSESGFKPGKLVRVIPENGRLVITSIEES